ncbi:MAG TPA: SAM-dependent chlorinase/fluorinase [Sedimentisphaerales bacterium]|nr:SAM-dependent chlorinase/fluorinase [Sedimentisphaerales bacterium]
MIVLLTDFGQSEYVGVMKAVIYGIAPDAKIVDLCHTIAPQSIIEASWILLNNYRYFPTTSIFCCVVDPGVGADRKAIAAKAGPYYFVGPDNGLLWETVRAEPITEIREIPIPQEASRTFHGRDVFAKAAANIELGGFDNLGTRIDRIAEMELYRQGREGIVVRIDGFANVVTNIDKLPKAQYSVNIGGKKIPMRFCPSYSSAQADELFLIEGSSNTLEISIKDGRANDVLHLVAGAKIEIS